MVGKSILLPPPCKHGPPPSKRGRLFALSVLRTALQVGEPRKKALASPFGRGGDFEEIFGEGLLPQSAS